MVPVDKKQIAPCSFPPFPANQSNMLNPTKNAFSGILDESKTQIYRRMQLVSQKRCCGFLTHVGSETVQISTDFKVMYVFPLTQKKMSKLWSYMLLQNVMLFSQNSSTMYKMLKHLFWSAIQKVSLEPAAQYTLWGCPGSCINEYLSS